MRAVKALVVVMGVMIVVGFGALIVIIIGRLGNRTPSLTASPPPAVGQPYAAPAIDLPPGARIETMAAGPDRIILDLILAGGDRQLLVIELATGKKLGTIPLRVAP